MLIKVIISVPTNNVVTGKSGLSGYCACPVEKLGKSGVKSIYIYLAAIMYMTTMSFYCVLYQMDNVAVMWIQV